MCALSQTKTTMTVEPEKLSSDEFAKALHEGSRPGADACAGPWPGRNQNLVNNYKAN
jgi:hypothetical protein